MSTLTSRADLDAPLYWEDLRVGDRASSDGRTVTESDLISFAALSGDFNQLHVDAEFAASTRFGERVVHGLLGQAIASGLFTRTWIGRGTAKTMVALLAAGCRFEAPIFVGDTVTVTVTVEELLPTSADDRGVLVLERLLIKQGGIVISRGTTRTLLARRSTGEPAS